MALPPRSARPLAPEGAAEAVIVCREAHTPAEVADHHVIRHRVFVEEQAIFAGSDRDGHDDAGAVKLVGYLDGVAAGSVRLFETDPASRTWQGDRLAVLTAYRMSGVGAPLVWCAVAIAGARGGAEMVAHIQPANVAFFTRLGWVAVGEAETYVGLPHQRMTIALPTVEQGVALARQLARGVDARLRWRAQRASPVTVVTPRSSTVA
jgi:putative N-acetyltransferase (TIGR04045 family)